MYDLMIIGAGPAGYVAAERAAHKGLRVVLFEKKNLGGVCLNEGCIPTKTLLYSAKTYENALNGEKYGIYCNNVSFEYEKMIARKNKVVRKLVAGVKAKMKDNNVTVIDGLATIKGKNENKFEIECKDEIYSGTNLLICTGSEAYIPPIQGIDITEGITLTNREILELKKQPESLVIIGGGVIGMEFASFFNSLGSKVTVIEMLPEILNGIDGEMATSLREVYEKKGIRFYLKSKVTKVDGKNVFFEYNDEIQHVEGEKILISVGRKSMVKGFGLENLNIETNNLGIIIDDKMATNVPGVFAAGDVTGFSLLAHTASREAEVVVNNLTGGADTMCYKAIPGVVYTNPEIAGVGETEESLKEKGKVYHVAKLPMMYSGRFVAENEGTNGICKILINDNETILGVHILGNPASELIFGACMAIEKQLNLQELKQIIFPHPTVSEIIKETLFALE